MVVLRPFLVFFFANYIIIFHKTEVLNESESIWFKSYDKNEKPAKTQTRHKTQKNKLVKGICNLCHRIDTIVIQTHLAPQNEHQHLNFVKDVYVVGKK